MTDDRPLITGIPAFQMNNAETEAELWFKLDEGPPLSVRMTPAAVEEAALRLVQLAPRLGDGNTKYPFGIGSRVGMSIARPIPSTNDVLVSVVISHAGLAPNFYMTSDHALELAQKLTDAARMAQAGDTPIQ